MGKCSNPAFYHLVQPTGLSLVKDHVNSPALGSRYFPTFGGEGVDDFGLSFFRYDSPSITK
jgi:hypothetical protein